MWVLSHLNLVKIKSLLIQKLKTNLIIMKRKFLIIFELSICDYYKFKTSYKTKKFKIREEIKLPKNSIWPSLEGKEME